MRFTIYGQPYVKKSNQKVVRLRSGRTVKIDTPSYKAWHASAIKQLRMLNKPLVPINYPINLECHFYRRTRGRVDLSALYEGIQDVLVEEKWLEDDAYTIVASHDGSYVDCDKENPRMEIIITAKGQDDANDCV